MWAVVALMACETGEEFTTSEGGLRYQLVREGEGPKPQNDEILLLHFRYDDANGNIMYSTELIGGPVAVMFHDSLKTDDGNLEDVFQLLGKGDSVVVKIGAEKLFANTFSQPLPDTIAPESDISFFIGVEDVMSQDAYNTYRMEQYQIQQEQAELAKAEQLKTDVEIITDYLEENNIEAEKTGDQTQLAKIIQMVQEAQGSKANIARIADKISYYFVPMVMIIAFFTGLAWFYLGNIGFSQSLRFFISVLVIACPCAMGLATPISIMVGTGRGAQLGILVRNGQTIESLEKVKTMLFDKTGTITRGRPEVVALQTMDGGDRNQFLELAASAEQSSEHPLAEAVVRYAQKEGVSLSQPDTFSVSSGKGITAVIKGKKVSIGNRQFIVDERSLEPDFEKSISHYADEGKTVLYASIEDSFAGILVVSDTIKPEAKKVVSSLHSLGIDVIMLTGDNTKTAEAVALAAGIEHVMAEVKPDQKAEKVKELQQKNNIVAMVGDGINDAPALARADIGIAMGTGIDIAIESGDIVLMKGELTGVISAVNLSKAVMKNIRQNLFWAFAYNVLGIPVAAGLLFIFGGPALNPMFAGAAMALSSLSVVTNALRLRFFENTKMV